MIAIAGTLLPLTYSVSAAEHPTDLMIFGAHLLAALGYGLSTLAMVDLGTSFGITPASRGGRCRTGVYRFLNHPMYIGYAIAEFSWLLLDITNLPIFIVSLFLQGYRAKLENRVLTRITVPSPAA